MSYLENTSSEDTACPLCCCRNLSLYHRDPHRHYEQCALCALVSVPQCYHLPRDDERAQYDLHTNSPDDQGYRQFLSRAAGPLNERIAPRSRGLDFGSGPGPTLPVMLEEYGHSVSLYDTHYYADVRVLQDRYDFITATEVVEHLASPGEELERLWGLLLPQGWLAVMTKLVISQARFRHWHYRLDPTHISFFSRETWAFLAARWGSCAEYFDNDVILLQKPA